jgi:uncharacterized repeat protein (TIGR03803 family)
MRTKFSTIVVACLILVQIAHAQLNTLYQFPVTNPGSNPMYSQPVFDGTWLYGTTSLGGVYNGGVIFKVMPDGSNYTVLTNFGTTNSGAFPYGSLIISNNTLYGMTFGDGGENGTIFKINTDGTNFTKLADFDGTAHGRNPYGSLTISNNTLYGMTVGGGSNGMGVIFKINTDGSGFTKLADFDGTAHGSNPRGSLSISGNTLYGMTAYGGSNNFGVVFSINTDGTGFTKLADFDGAAHGKKPYGSLTILNNTLYGTTCYGGTNDMGVVFKINTDGTDFTGLANFDGTAHGQNPYSTLTEQDNILYGTAIGGGVNGLGTIFKINTDGTGFTKLSDFDGTNHGSYPYSLALLGNTMYGFTENGGIEDFGAIVKINTDGTGFTKIVDLNIVPCGNDIQASVVRSGNLLYGVAYSGGANNLGTIYKINTDGTGFTRLADFDGLTHGSHPRGSLTISGNILYGMTSAGGTKGTGVIFKINADGTNFTKLTDFDRDKGRIPYGSLTLSGSVLYGMTSNGGTNDFGTIFKINTDGTNFTKLADFDGADHGSYPYGSLTLSGNVLYGTTSNGGTNHQGVIFKINTDGTAFTKLADFDTDHGIYPNESLIISGNTLYGITPHGGTNNFGTIYKINTDGTGFTKLIDFNNQTSGAYPQGTLAINGSILYGATMSGGTVGYGTLFKVNTNGTGFAKLVDFNTANGSRPCYGSLEVQTTTAGVVLYGTTELGGSAGAGTIFSYTIPSTPSPVPTISWFTPTTATKGTTVTIVGTNFTGATSVSFGGIPAASFSVLSAYGITAVVASGASGNVSVTTPYGTATLGGFYISQVSGVQDNMYSGIKAYPNPVSSTLTVENIHSTGKWLLISIEGKVVSSGFIDNNLQSVSIPMENYRTGSYIFILFSSSGKEFFRTKIEKTEN